MKEEIIAKRYADAFMSYAKGNVGMSAAAQELEQVKLVLSGNPDFLGLLASTGMIYSEKCAFIDKVMHDFSEPTRIFLKLLLEKDRIRNIFDIADYARENYSHAESMQALLKTSYPLDAELIAKIKEKLEAKFKRKMDLHIELDGNLLGGVQVRVGNTLIDGSVRKRLDGLREKLMEVKV